MRRFMAGLVALGLTAPMMMLTGCDSPSAQPESKEPPRNPSPAQPAPGGGAPAPAPAPAGETPAPGAETPAPAPAPAQSPGL